MTIGKQKNQPFWLIFLFCDPAGARTQDPNIKSVVLYLLSYRVNLSAFCGCKSTAFFDTSAFFNQIFLFVQKSFPLTDDNDFIISAIHNGAFLKVAGTAVDDDVHQVFILLVNFLGISLFIYSIYICSTVY